MEQSPSPSGPAFAELNIIPQIMGVLAQRRLTNPTPIQHQAIPALLEGKDVIGIAQTGTGKTLAFGIPMVQRLHQHGGRGLILVPTRELADQVEGSLSSVAKSVGIGTAIMIGGASMHMQKLALKRNPRILIATPGRLNDHLEQGTVTLREVSILVLDEADRMLDMGFLPQIQRILKHVPAERQTMLFSATMAPELVRLATGHMKLPLRIEVAPAGTTVKAVEQELFVVRREEKIRLLETLLQENEGTVLVFSRTKHGAKKITRSVNGMGHTAAEIHGNRSLAQRRDALEGFKTGRYRVLVATDIAARGIHVTGIAVVINFDLPNDPADYVHRIGRTARAGRNGRAISFATPDQINDVRGIERLIRAPIPRKALPALPPPRTGEPDLRDRPKHFGHAPRSSKPRHPHPRRRGNFRRSFR